MTYQTINYNSRILGERNVTIEVQYNDDGSGPLRFRLKFQVASENEKYR